MGWVLDGRRGLTGYGIARQVERQIKQRIRSKKTKERSARVLSEVEATIEKTRFGKHAKQNARLFFRRMARVEANVHKTTMRQVHLHEVARKENILRVLAIFAALERAGVRHFICTPINTGSGRVKTAHGWLRVPTPATRELLRGLPTVSRGKGELTTPTGACFARMLCRKFISSEA